MIDRSIYLRGWFDEPGAYVLVDGQFGSTGKGLLAGFLAEYGAGKITHVTTNAGPNSGHTAYMWQKNREDLKVMTQQIPVASVFLRKMGYDVDTLLNAGAVIDPAILAAECLTYGFTSERVLSIHPNAALIGEKDKSDDRGTVHLIAGTGKGVGPAQAAKIMRQHGLNAIASSFYQPMFPARRRPDLTWDRYWDWSEDVVFVETAQGYSLGVNSHRFYPNVTSRECTVMQALADARIPAQKLKKVVACYRTFPIRVGDTENSSGGCYEDQVETSWEELGLEPELTTVTKRRRRVFTWSRVQFRESIAANMPDLVFLNFCNYLQANMLSALVENIIEDCILVMGKVPDILLGTGPRSEDIRKAN